MFHDTFHKNSTFSEELDIENCENCQRYHLKIMLPAGDVAIGKTRNRMLPAGNVVIGKTRNRKVDAHPRADRHTELMETKALCALGKVYNTPSGIKVNVPLTLSGDARYRPGDKITMDVK